MLLDAPQCTKSSVLEQNFSLFISQCTSPADRSARQNLINPNDITEIIQKEKAIYDDLITSLRGINDLKGSGGSAAGQTANVASINEQIEKVEQERKEIDTKTEVQNQIFLQSITKAPKKTSRLANLNDISLGIFFGSIFIFIVVVTVIQGTKINGSLTTALYTLIGGIVMAIVIYALVKEVA